MASGYRPRIADAELRACLAVAAGCVASGAGALEPGSAVPADGAERHTGAGRFSL